jgi:putative thioredoxin
MTFILGKKTPPTSSVLGIEKPSSSGEEQKISPKSTDIKNFTADVLTQSQKKPVVIEFWSDRVPQGKGFSALLEKVLSAYQNTVAFVRMNAESNMALLSQLGIRGLPTVYVFDKGQLVDGFSGILGDRELKTFLEALFGAPRQDLRAVLKAAYQERKSHNPQQATLDYQSVLQEDPENLEALAGLAHCYIDLGQPETAKGLLNSLTDVQRQKNEMKQVQDHLSLYISFQEAEKALQNGTLLEQEKNYYGALKDFFEKKEEVALETLLSLLLQDKKWGEGKAHKQLILMLEVLGTEDLIAVSCRQKLARLLFS